MSKKILFNLDNINDFCREKILFLYPIGNSIDMEYFYITNYNNKIPCNCIFDYNNIDLRLEFYNLEDSFHISEIEEDILHAINKFNCIVE